MPRTPHVQFRATGRLGQALTDRTVHLDSHALADTARTVITAWHDLMRTELAGLALDETTVNQLLDVMGGTVIDAAFWGDPANCLIGEIEDCLDDDTGKTAYPGLLDAANLWSPAGCAAVLDAVVRLRARAKADPDEGRAKALRAVGLRGER